MEVTFTLINRCRSVASFLMASAEEQKPIISVVAKFDGDNVGRVQVYKGCNTVVKASLTIHVTNTLSTQSQLSVTCSRTTYVTSKKAHSNKEVIFQSDAVEPLQNATLVKLFNFTANIKAQDKFFGRMGCKAYLKFTNTLGNRDYLSVRAQSKEHVYKFVLDVNECILGRHNCHKYAHCINTEGSYKCECKSGFAGDGIVCDDVNECATSPDPCGTNGSCMNLEGGYTCRCDAGYKNKDGVCQDVDECATGTYQCNQNADCVNTMGSYGCVCKAGFEESDRECIDMNECNRAHTCHSNAECINSIGTYTCLCKPGYYGNGLNCYINGITCDFDRSDTCGWTVTSNTNEFGWELEHKSHGCTVFSGNNKSQNAGEAILTSHKFKAGTYCFKFRIFMDVVKGYRSLSVYVMSNDPILVFDTEEYTKTWRQYFITIHADEEAQLQVTEDRVDNNEGTVHLDDLVFTAGACQENVA